MSLKRSQAASKRFHIALAMAFLFVMLVEWGSHNLAFAHSGSSQGIIAVNTLESEHDDPCRTMADCCQSRKRGGTVVSPSHHLPSFTSFAELIRFVPSYSQYTEAAPPIREDVQRIFRPKDPLLHPPELS